MKYAVLAGSRPAETVCRYRIDWRTDDLTYREIGELVGKSEAATKMVIHRTLRRLQDEWEGHASGMPDRDEMQDLVRDLERLYAAIAILAVVPLVGVLQILLRGAAGRGDGPGPAPDVAILQTEQQPEDELPERLARGETAAHF